MSLQDEYSYDEKALLLKVAEGDEEAFKQLFLHWQPLLASYIFRITESREHTEEIVQDVFLKIWMTRETLKSIENFKNYLLVVSRNHARNALRTVMREKRRINTWAKQNLIVVDNPQEEELRLLKQSIIDEAIQNLPAQQKKVYLLHRHEKFTYKQVAAMMGISAETVKDYLRTSKASISKYISSRLSVISAIFF